MKFLKLIIVLVITFLGNFAFADEITRESQQLTVIPPAFSIKTFLNVSASGCPSYYYLCANGVGCCPVGAACLPDYKCDVKCTSKDIPCGDGCCPSTQSCGPNGLCQKLTCPSGYYGCTDSSGGCCPNGYSCVPNYKCQPNSNSNTYDPYTYSPDYITSTT
ncbi:927_t:CDS:1, partial [Acaulospora morrowiae]